MVFGFTGADDIETVARKRGYMAEAQAHWPFLTHFDASTIKKPASARHNGQGAMLPVSTGRRS
jgi:hypothetical protein